MTDVAEMASTSMTRVNRDNAAVHLRKRYAAERRFRFYGLSAILIAIAMLVVLLGSMIGKGYSAFWQTEIRLNVFFDPEVVDRNALKDANYTTLIRNALQEQFPDASRSDRRALGELVSGGAQYDLAAMVQKNPDLIGTTQPIWLLASDIVDQFEKGYIPMTSISLISEKQQGWLADLRSADAVEGKFNQRLFFNADSRDPEMAGIWGALIGSILTLTVTLVMSVPVGIAAAVYLEEFAPKNRLTDLIEVNINNLAAVPSIIFGLLGLAVFLSVFGLPRSAPLVGGMVLALRTLPIIIITTRSALKAVPPSIRQAALGIGASKLQTVTHHVLPLAMPGILTGTIIGMAHALGETAPLLMIGMVAFVLDAPGGLTDPATVLPVQIFMWAESPERAFVERTSAATLILLAFLLCMNAVAIYLRKRFERRW